MAVFAAIFARPVAAQVPQLINYQGRVVVGSTNFNGTGQFKFALVDTTGATTYWSNDGTSTAGSAPAAFVTLPVNQGLYSVMLGDTTVPNMTAVPATVFANTDVRLRVWFNDGTHGFQLLSPDQRITAVGYAMVAASVPNGSITSAQLANGAVGSAQLANGAVGAGQIASGAVGAGQIASGAIGSNQLSSTLLNTVQNGAYPIGPSNASIVCIGDSLVGGGVLLTDPRQTWPAILASMGFARNSTVYSFGFGGYSEYSVNSEFNASSSVWSWTSTSATSTTVSTSPAAIGGTNNYAVIVASGSDYCGVYLNATESTSSRQVTGMSRTYYLTDLAGYNRPIAVGDAVSGPGIPAGTTVASVDSASALTLSKQPTAAGVNLLTFTPSPTTSNFASQLTSLIGKCKASGYKVVVCTTTPADNTATPADGVTSQGDFQANLAVYNNYVRSLTYDGIGNDPDKLVDLAATPDLGTFNPALWCSDLLHPNFAGNQAYAGYINNGLMSLVTPSSYAYPYGTESVTPSMLPTGTAYTNQPETFVAPFTVQAPSNSSQGSALRLIGGTYSAQQYPADIFLTAQVGQISDVWDVHSDLVTGGHFQILDTQFAGRASFDIQQGSTGGIWLGDNTKTGTVTVQGGGPVALTAGSTLSLNGTDVTVTSGNLEMSTAGKTLSIKGGSNAASGTVTLSGGTGTITSTAINQNSVIILSIKTPGGTPGTATPQVIVSAGSATIKGVSTDSSTYNWGMLIMNQ